MRFVVLPLCLFAASASGQALPAAVASPRYEGFHLPTLGGSLNYALNFSERVDNGYNGGDVTAYSTNLGGDLAYLSSSQTHPFSLIYSGGYLIGNANQPSSLYQNLALSQSVAYRKYTFVVSDSFNYLPQTPTAGLSGIPGVGDGGLPPVDTGVDSGQTILTQNSTRVLNTLSGSAQRTVTGKTTLNVFSSYGVIDYVGDSKASGISGLNSSQDSVGGGFSHRVSVRTSYSANYNYNNLSYSGVDGLPSNPTDAISLHSQSLNLGFNHQFTRKAFLNVSLGPQRTSSTFLADPSYGLAANILMNYSSEFVVYSATYTSGTNSGSGVAAGANTQAAVGTLSRPLGRAWHASTSLGYTRSSNLPVLGGSAFRINAVIGTAQVNRALSRNLSAFFSYTAQSQTVAGSFAATNSFKGISQVVGFGLTYAPATRHLGGR